MIAVSSYLSLYAKQQLAVASHSSLGTALTFKTVIRTCQWKCYNCKVHVKLQNHFVVGFELS